MSFFTVLIKTNLYSMNLHIWQIVIYLGIVASVLTARKLSIQQLVEQVKQKACSCRLNKCVLVVKRPLDGRFICLKGAVNPIIYLFLPGNRSYSYMIVNLLIYTMLSLLIK